jgi:streptogramin lyase
VERRATIRVGNDPTDIAVGLEAAWVGDLDGSLYRIDPLTREVQEFPIGPEVLGLAVVDESGSVWAYLGEATPAGG